VAVDGSLVVVSSCPIIITVSPEKHTLTGMNDPQGR
jgi:hypothetical protein